VDLILILGLVLAALVGGAVGFFARQRVVSKQAELAEATAERIEAEATARKNEILLEANNEALKLRKRGRGRGARAPPRAPAE